MEISLEHWVGIISVIQPINKTVSGFIFVLLFKGTPGTKQLVFVCDTWVEDQLPNNNFISKC